MLNNGRRLAPESLHVSDSFGDGQGVDAGSFFAEGTSVEIQNDLPHGAGFHCAGEVAFHAYSGVPVAFGKWAATSGKYSSNCGSSPTAVASLASRAIRFQP